LTTIYMLHSGNFLTPAWTRPDPTGTTVTGSSTPVQVTIRPTASPIPTCSVNQWFNSAAFTAAVAGAFGSCAKGAIKGPGISQANGGAGRDFRLAERVKLRLEVACGERLQSSQLVGAGLEHHFGIAGRRHHRREWSEPYDAPGMRFLRYGARVE
jgi:hypothetical protein